MRIRVVAAVVVVASVVITCTALAAAPVPKLGEWSGQTSQPPDAVQSRLGVVFHVTKKGKTQRIVQASTGGFEGCEFAETKGRLLAVRYPPAAKITSGHFKVVWSGGSGGEKYVFHFAGKFLSKTRASGSIVIEYVGHCTTSMTWTAKPFVPGHSAPVTGR